MKAQPNQPEKAYFKDDGSIPNSALPLLLYRQAFAPGTPNLASAIEKGFAKNDWTGSWRASVFPFHHYHSTSHEVLAVYRGTATLQFGGEKGRKFAVKPGDVIVIPAGVGHKRVENSEDFSVVGAYPGGRMLGLLGRIGQVAGEIPGRRRVLCSWADREVQQICWHFAKNRIFPQDDWRVRCERFP